ncbi:BTAD domain-containing putative transcriptional regulator [Streptomyces sp. HNM0645]|uniref:AfsR/SARP family transcriptional regulator n=1 Tax=Streptomyces sp. HNM0645 TaxID=2782343 RepID=UPI0024B757CD|nr:BTAD domain-containing putative transcriptional regulator [Streptomyces sp. HNM0645]MDI9886791.1 BTAD domain-containing putative transcriptional regulator [Streptomyces sp. HNM0645]
MAGPTAIAADSAATSGYGNNFGILGPLSVTVQGKELALDSAKLRILLAALLVRSGTVVSNERLAEWLWEERKPSNPRGTLHTYVRRLRLLLGDALPLETAAGGYRIDVPEDELDFQRFRGLVRTAHRSEALEERARLLAAALATWRGAALEDVPSSSLHLDECRPMEDERLAALEAYFETDLQLGRHAQLVRELRAAAMDNPLRENFWSMLMLALYRSGRQAEALDVYQQARRHLVEQLGIEPGERLRTLHTGILESDPALAVPDGPGSGAGETGPVPAQLPPLGAGFVGRKAVIDRISASLPPVSGRTSVPVVVLSGPPGVGKTALAVCVGRRVRPTFPDGQLYVDLSGYDRGEAREPLPTEQVLSQFLRALGVPAKQIPVDLVEQANLYRSKLTGKKVLVVLDNAAGVEQVVPLIPGDGGCSVLITSRRQLRSLVVTHGAQLIQVDTLSTPESVDLVAGMMRQAAVAIDPETVREVTALCSCLPLALRIAAANLIGAPGGQTEVYLESLRRGKRLAALSVDGDTTSAVSNAIALSYYALTPDDRVIFRLAGLFPGSDFSPAAVSVLADISEAQARAGLSRLEMASLLQQPAPGRYQFHDLLREYAQDRAAEEHPGPERAEAVERLGRWYLAGVCAAADVLYSEFVRLAEPSVPLETFDAPRHGDESHSMAWLLAERRNLMACVRYFGAHGPHYLSWHIADALRGFFWTGKYRTEWRETTRTALAAAEARADDRGIAAMHRSLANLANTLGDYEWALVHQEKSLAVHDRLGMAEEAAATLNNMSLAHLSLGRGGRAQEAAQRALDIAHTILSPRLEATAKGVLGFIHWTRGDIEGATEYLTASLATAGALGLHHISSYSLRNLGLVHQATGELTEARSYFGQALEVSEAIDSSYDRSVSLYGLALVDLDIGRYDSACESAERALSSFQECGDRTYEVETLCLLSAISGSLGSPQRSARYAATALDGARQIGYVDGEAYALARLAVADGLLGRDAAGNAEAARSLADSSTNRMARSKILLDLAQLYLTLSAPDRAEECARQVLCLSQPGAQRLNIARAEEVLGAVAASGGDHAQARVHWNRALATFTDIGVIVHTDLAERLATTSGQGRTAS